MQFARTESQRLYRQVRRQRIVRLVRFWFEISMDFYTAEERLHRPHRV